MNNNTVQLPIEQWSKDFVDQSAWQTLFISVFISLMSTCSLAESVNNCTTVDDDLRTCYSIYAPAVYVDLNDTWEQNCEK